MSLLLTPGPVDVPEFVLQAISQSVIPHRSAEFESFYEAMLHRLRYLFQSEGKVCTMIGSGTGGVEAAMYSLFPPGSEVLIVSMGKFSRRWADYGREMGLRIHEIVKEWGETVKMKELLDYLEQHPNIIGCVLTHCETSTGVIIDLEEIAFAVKQRFPTHLILVDAITTVGAVPFYFDKWKVDLAVTASQKSLMNPAGVVCFALSAHAVNYLRPTHSSDYRNLHNYVSFAEKNNYPYTPPVQLLYGVNAALSYIQEKTLPFIWNQTHISSQIFKKGVQLLGANLFAELPSDSLTSFFFETVSAPELKEYLEKEAQIVLSGGQAHLKGKILRISHMGLSTDDKMRLALQAISEFLKKPVHHEDVNTDN